MVSRGLNGKCIDEIIHQNQVPRNLLINKATKSRDANYLHKYKESALNYFVRYIVSHVLKTMCGPHISNILWIIETNLLDKSGYTTGTIHGMITTFLKPQIMKLSLNIFPPTTSKWMAASSLCLDLQKQFMLILSYRRVSNILWNLRLFFYFAKHVDRCVTCTGE